MYTCEKKMRDKEQRERAVNEYTQAQRTRDNTQGAQDEVAKYLKTPYQQKTDTP